MKVTKAQIRKIVREALGVEETHEQLPSLNVSQVVDPSSAETVPLKPSYSPQDQAQFNVAIRSLVKHLQDEDLPGLYDKIKQLVDKVNINKEKNERR